MLPLSVIWFYTLTPSIQYIVYCTSDFWMNGQLTTYNTHTHPCNDSLSGTTQVSRYQKGKTNLDFIGARDSE